MTFEDVSSEMLYKLKGILKEHGAHVDTFPVTSYPIWDGMIYHPSAKLRWKYFIDRKELEIHIVEDNGHFPGQMLVGGMKQLIEEVREDLCRKV